MTAVSPCVAGEGAASRVVHAVDLLPADAEAVGAAVLAHALLNAVDHGDGLVVRHRPPNAPSGPSGQFVVVAPSTARGLAAAGALIESWRPELPPPGLLVVRDAPLPPPPVVVARARLLGRRVVLSAEIPYLPQVRLVDEYAHALQGRGRRLARARRRLVLLRKRLYVAAGFLYPAAPVRAPVPLLALTDPAAAARA